MPTYFIVSSDGKKFPISEKAAAFSTLFQGAKQVWREAHDKPEDDDVDTPAVVSDGTDSEATPDRLDHYNTDETSSAVTTEGLEEQREGDGHIALRRMVSVKEDEGGAGKAVNGEDDDATASDVDLDDEDSDRTASMLPSHDSRSVSNASSVGSNACLVNSGATPPRSHSVGTTVKGSKAAARTSPPAAVTTKVPNGATTAGPSAADAHAVVDLATADPRAVLTLDRGGEDSRTPSTISDDDAGGDNSPLPRVAKEKSKDSTPDAPTAPNSTATNGVAKVAPLAQNSIIKNRTSTVVVAMPGEASDEEEGDGGAEGGPSVGASPGDTGWISPASLHQRTPIIFGAEEADTMQLLGGDGKEQTIRTPRAEGAAHSGENSPAAALPNFPSIATLPQPVKATTSPRGSSLNAGNGGSLSREKSLNAAHGVAPPPSVNVNGGAGGSELLYDSACVTPSSIFVKLETPRKSASTSGGAAASTSTAPPDTHNESGTIELCVAYLEHFAAAAEQPVLSGARREDIPTELPQPLSAPLVALLSSWEVQFLYTRLLLASHEMQEAAQAVVKACPTFDYRYPATFLKEEHNRRLLIVPAPAPEGVANLKKVMAAAAELRIPTLHCLCKAWLADFMIRASYGATDNFEAAHLIRQCFRVNSVWNRRETDCLKVENEWPANEEEA